jgi:colanic acid/amylovoran biosynthesis glycosyltransferase
LPKPGHEIMDMVELPAESLPYRVLPIETDRRGEPAGAFQELDDLFRASNLVIGSSFGVLKLARRHAVPYIACLEYDFQTQLTMVRSFARSPLHAAWSMAQCALNYYRDMVPTMRHAHEIHCNGYPVFRASARYNSRRLLYLDSRMAQDLIIEPGALLRRLASRSGRSLRLLFSGRFEKVKGALDAVLAAVACLQRGMDVELDCYGAGSLRNRMLAASASHAGKIRIHPAIPFEDLVQRSREADIFICCHIQSDPSCTYIESMGSGLPIVGYGNRMWSALAAESQAGVVTARDSPGDVAAAIQDYIERPAQLEVASESARKFALKHCFENEFGKRTSAISAAARRPSARV